MNKEDDGHTGPWVAGPEVLQEEATQKREPKKKPYAKAKPKEPKEVRLDWRGKSIVKGNGGKETDRKRVFARAYVETCSWKMAYETAYSTENMSDTMIRVNAWQLKGDDFIQAEIKRLRRELEDRLLLTQEEVVRMLMEDRQLAYEPGHSAAAVQATAHIAKIMGWYTTEHKVHVTHDIDQMNQAQLRTFIQEQSALLGPILNQDPLLLEKLPEPVDAEYEEVEPK